MNCRIGILFRTRVDCRIWTLFRTGVDCRIGILFITGLDCRIVILFRTGVNCIIGILFKTDVGIDSILTGCVWSYIYGLQYKAIVCSLLALQKTLSQYIWSITLCTMRNNSWPLKKLIRRIKDNKSDKKLNSVWDESGIA